MAFLLLSLVALLLLSVGILLARRLQEPRPGQTSLPLRPPKHLLDLPPELLQKILASVFSDLGPVIPQPTLYRTSQQIRRAAPPRDHTAVFLVCKDINANSKAVFFKSIVLRIPTVSTAQILSFCTLRYGLRQLQCLEMSVLVLHVLRWPFIIRSFPELRLLTLAPFVITTTAYTARQRQQAPAQLTNACTRLWEELILTRSVRPSPTHRANQIKEHRDRELVIFVMQHIHGPNPLEAFIGNEDGDDWSPGRFVPRLHHENYEDCVREIRGLWRRLEPGIRALPSGIRHLRVKLDVQLRITNPTTGGVTCENFAIDLFTEWYFRDAFPLQE